MAAPSCWGRATNCQPARCARQRFQLALLDFDGTSQAITELSGGGSTAGNVSLGGGTLTLGDSTSNTPTFSGVVADSGGAAGNNVTGGSLVKTGTNTQVLGNVETYTGPTTISAGTLALQDISLGTTAALPASTILTVTNGGTFQTNGQARRRLRSCRTAEPAAAP